MRPGRDGKARSAASGRRVAAAVLLFLGLALAPGEGTAGDAEMARFLLQGAKDDVARKAYGEAVKKLEKAAKEDPGLIEVSYWMGQACEGRKNPRAAVAAYRAYRAAYAKKRADATTSRDEDATLSKTTARLTAIAPAETELERIRAAFTSQLHALAEENFVRDPAVSKRALRTVLEVDPANGAAQRLYERLGGKIELPGPADADVGFTVKSWTDYVAQKKIESDGIVSYEGDLMVLTARTGKLVKSQPENTGKRYVIDYEVRFVEDYDPKRTTGVSFGDAEGVLVAIMLGDRKADLVTLDRERGADPLVKTALVKDGLPVGAWRRFTVVVDGTRVAVRCGEELLYEAEIPDRTDLDGDVGIYVQQCRAEVRRLRVGRPD
jgi:hypothetical protein